MRFYHGNVWGLLVQFYFYFTNIENIYRPNTDNIYPRHTHVNKFNPAMFEYVFPKLLHELIPAVPDFWCIIAMLDQSVMIINKRTIEYMSWETVYIIPNRHLTKSQKYKKTR